MFICISSLKTFPSIYFIWYISPSSFKTGCGQTFLSFFRSSKLLQNEKYLNQRNSDPATNLMPSSRKLNRADFSSDHFNFRSVIIECSFLRMIMVTLISRWEVIDKYLAQCPSPSMLGVATLECQKIGKYLKTLKNSQSKKSSSSRFMIRIHAFGQNN